MKKILLLLLLVKINLGFSQQPSSSLYVDLQKLYSLKKILYIAAHPDDENTRALAWFSLGEYAQTAYLSLTRGDGGQNLIGNELGEDLGVLRTQELLAARSYDGAKQYFTRAVDFGYSKSAEESFKKWGKEQILADVVLMIRKFKPDIIITRFPPDGRGGHGHHTASAILAIEAFSKAADPHFLPNQVNEFGIWKTTAIYWNASNWWNKNLDKEAQNNDNYLVVDIGEYSPLLGKSYNEIGTIARSQHKCQGFGAVIERGSQLEYFQYLEGEKLKNSFFEKNTKLWSSILNTNIESEFQKLLKNFNFINPEKNVPALIAIKKELESLPPSIFKEEKLRQCNKLIIDCLGLYIDVLKEDYALVKNGNLEATVNLINRSKIALKLVALGDNKMEVDLPLNTPISETIKTPGSTQLSNPYWLNVPFVNTYVVPDKNNLLKAQNDPTFTQSVTIRVLGEEVTLRYPVIYKWKKPDYGEKKREVVSTPSFTVNFSETQLISKPDKEKIIKLHFHSFKPNLKEEITIEAPNGWQVAPNKIKIEINEQHQEKWEEITLKPTEKAQRGILKLKDNKGNELYSLTEITYDHIPTQIIFKPAELTCIKLDTKIYPGKIAYIKGAEDVVPQAIEQLGFDIKVFNVADLANLNLKEYQSVVLGIRIYNVYPELVNFETLLFDYVKNGGNLVMQYNTASRSNPESKYGGPLPFELSYNRVTEEDAPVTFLDTEHPIMNYPNKITQDDFKNWVQERGLYFATNWDIAYKPLLAWNDKGEEPQKGGLLVAKYGKGQFIYTGISFFRELPSGVEGAYRLFANLLSYNPEEFK